MNVGLIIIVILGLIIFAFVSKNRTENNVKIKNNGTDTLDNNIIEDKFFERVSSGETRLPFLKIDNQFDLMFIKSLFQSEQIPYYIDFEHISKVRPGMMIGDLGNYNLLYILENDYDDALEVIHTYLENKINEYNGKDEKGKHLIEILFSNWKVPSAGDIDGLRILYKSNNESIKFRKRIEKLIELKKRGNENI
jgi:hypothetical protein